MAPLAMRMSCAGRKVASRVAQAPSAPARQSMLAARRVHRHVARSTKLAEIAETNAKLEKKSKKAEKEEEEEFEGDEGLTPEQVESFLTVLCEETNIAEVELKMGGFKMKVRRSLNSAAMAAATAAAPAAAAPAAAPAPTPAAPAPVSMPDLESSFDEADESVLAVPANKVGLLRRGRYVKGKQVGKAMVVQVGDQVKKGQVICYIEQLGTFWPLECPQAGEMVDFLLEEGAPVEYGEPVAEIAPFFGGHIIGEAKYA